MISIPALGAAIVLAGTATSFADIEYTSLKNQPWSEKTKTLEALSSGLGVSAPLNVTYVEQNVGGKGPIVFVHGLGSNLKFWRYQIDVFAARGYHVIAIDLPGFGKSDKPRDFSYAIDDQARVLRAFLDALAIKKPIVIGHSMGGHTGLVYAINYPKALKALVLVSPAGFEAFSKKDKAWLKSVFTPDLIQGLGEPEIRSSIVNTNFSKWKDEYQWLIDQRLHIKTAPKFEDYALANVKAVHGLLETELVRKNLGKIRVPTLIAYGHSDLLIPNRVIHPGKTQDVMKFGHAGIKDSVLVGFDGCGHTLQIDCSNEVNSKIESFLKKRGL
ncbi:MAG: alpha/beta hydrolase [Myxococcota bacterium]